MLPVLGEGALIAAARLDSDATLRVGEVVVARRPDRISVEMVKRIRSVDGQGNVFLLGDNPAASTDSRHFGVVPRNLVLARVRWRYWPLPIKRL